MEVRTITSDDWPVWRELRLKALGDAPEAFGSSLSDWVDANATAWRQRLQDVAFNVIAEDLHAPVGQASGTAVDGDHVELISMWVDASVRGNGVAGMLIEAVCAWAGGMGAAEVRLSVRRSNERAIRSYLSSGFLTAGRAGDDPAEVAMVRTL